MRYRDGARGFSASSRAGLYGDRSIAEHVETSDRTTAVICQIEHPHAVHAADEIARVEGVDCLFVGRADLAVALGVHDAAAPAVEQALEAVLGSGRTHGLPVGVHVADPAQAAAAAERGARLIIVGSDQSLLLTAARAAALGSR
jgi:2-keto-3-deoxy-L-rhamnonate aldolase RhmA